jgi:hypothetical protein
MKVMYLMLSQLFGVPIPNPLMAINGGVKEWLSR